MLGPRRRRPGSYHPPIDPLLPSGKGGLRRLMTVAIQISKRRPPMQRPIPALRRSSWGSRVGSTRQGPAPSRVSTAGKWEERRGTHHMQLTSGKAARIDEQ